MITPYSYKFKVIDHLVTNFHAPDSTLMLLVSAFLSKESNVKNIYEEAQRDGFRFLSCGDACCSRGLDWNCPVKENSTLHNRIQCLSYPYPAGFN
jgi:hypothetical protein